MNRFLALSEARQHWNSRLLRTEFRGLICLPGNLSVCLSICPHFRPQLTSLRQDGMRGADGTVFCSRGSHSPIGPIPIILLSSVAFRHPFPVSVALIRTNAPLLSSESSPISSIFDSIIERGQPGSAESLPSRQMRRASN